MSDIIKSWIENHVGWIAFNRPDSANAVIPELLAGAREQFQEYESSDDVGVIVLTGEGNTFCTGADLNRIQRLVEEYDSEDMDPLERKSLVGDLVEQASPFTQGIYDSPKPVIAAINGAATGGGMDFALASDLRYAAEGAKLGQTYVRIGLPPMDGGTYFLPRLTSECKALELMMTGRIFRAEEAREAGIINEVLPPEELREQVQKVAEQICRVPAGTLRLIKKMVRTPRPMDLSMTLETIKGVTADPEHVNNFAKGARAFTAGKTPVFREWKDSS